MKCQLAEILACTTVFGLAVEIKALGLTLQSRHPARSAFFGTHFGYGTVAALSLLLAGGVMFDAHP